MTTIAPSWLAIGMAATASTNDYITAITETRPTLTPHVITAFAEDIDAYTCM